MFQSGRTTFLQSFVQHKPAFIVHIVVEVYIRTDHLVAQQEPTCLGKRISVCLGVNQHDVQGQRGLQQTLGGIIAQSCGLGNLALRLSVAVLIQELQYAILDHQTANLKHYRSPGVQMCQLLCLTGIVLLPTEYFLYIVKQMHLNFLTSRRDHFNSLTFCNSKTLITSLRQSHYSFRRSRNCYSAPC